MNEKKRFTIGVLIPQSGLMPAIGRDIIDGVRLGISKESISSEIFVEDIGKGTNKELIIEKAQKLVLQLDVDVVIAYVGNDLAYVLEDYFHNNQKLLFIINSAAKRKYKTTSPYVFYNHFGLWQSSYLLGNYAAKNIGKRAITISSFYESGYDFVNAFVKGYTGEEGFVEKIIVVKQETGKQKFNELIEELSYKTPDVLYAVFNGNEAEEFLDFFYENSLNTKTKLIVSPIMFGGQILEKKIDEVFTCSSWLPMFSIGTNEEFVEQYKDKREKIPNHITLLAYEVMLLISSAAESANGKVKNLMEQLPGQKVIGPRGELLIDKESNTTCVENNYIISNQIENNLIYVKPDAKTNNLIFLEKDENISGWLNPYLCT